MKKLLLFFSIPLFAILFVSCEGGNGPGSTGYYRGNEPLYDALSDSEGLEITTAGNFLNQTASGWEELTLCAGIKNNKLWIGLYRNDESYTPENPKFISVYTWTDTEEIEQSMEIDFGFGDKKICDFRTVGIFSTGKSGIKFTNGNVFVCLSLTYTNDAVKDKYIKITPDGRAEIVSEVPVRDFILWFEESFIAKTSMWESIWVYDFDGELLFQTDISGVWAFTDYDWNHFEPVSLEQCIVIDFDGNSRGDIERIDIRSAETLWNSSFEFSFESSVRRDGWELTKKDGNDWHYTFNYTLYSGEKVTRELSVDIDTGEITYL